jgi:hypothetical protein
LPSPAANPSSDYAGLIVWEVNRYRRDNIRFNDKQCCFRGARVVESFASVTVSIKGGYVMDDTLNIAMDYLYRTGHATRFKEAQSTAARAMIVAWQSDVKHRIKLANVAIRAVEQNEPAQPG